MPTNKAFHRRIQILDQCLRRRQMLWTADALLEATNSHLSEHGCPEISRRTLYDDLRYLQSTLDAPVEKFQRGKAVCYRYSDPGYTLVNSPLSQAEKDLLRKMLDYLRANGLPMQADIEALLDRHGVLFEADKESAAEPRKKSEVSELRDEMAPAPAQFISRSIRHEPEEMLLNKLVLRMEGDDLLNYRSSFWHWLENRP